MAKSIDEHVKDLSNLVDGSYDTPVPTTAQLKAFVTAVHMDGWETGYDDATRDGKVKIEDDE